MPCDPLRDLRAWQERLERMAAQRGTAWDPPMDVYETETRYVVSAELPGLSRNDIEIAVQDNRLSIRGTRAAGARDAVTHHYHQVERGYGSFQRTFEFVDAVDQDGIAADLRDGVLTVTLPKLATEARRIDVQ